MKSIIITTTIIIIISIKFIINENENFTINSSSLLCPSIENYSNQMTIDKEHFHIIINKSTDTLYLNECANKNRQISEYMVKCVSNSTWIREKTIFHSTVHLTSTNDSINLCDNKDYKRLYICFNLNVLQSCNGGTELGAIEYLLLILLSIIPLLIILSMIFCFINNRNRKSMIKSIKNRSINTYNYSNYENDSRGSHNVYHTIDSITEERFNDYNSLEIEENLVRNPSYETLKSMDKT